jgi:hypothetical protein
VAPRPLEALLVETFGLRLLAYLCDSGEGEMEERIEGGVSLSAPAEAVLVNYLVPLAESVAQHRMEHPGLPVAFALEPLGRFDAAVGTTVGNALRAAAGGIVPEPLPGTTADHDPVKSQLFRLGRDAYPQLLAPVEEPWHVPHLLFFHHPARVGLDKALAEDDQLSRLYPDDDPGLGRRGAIFNSLGQGHSIQSVMFGETIISAAWDAATMTTEVPSLDDLFKAIDSNVDVIRAAVDGGQPQVPALLVFTGVATAGSRVIRTPWGPLRPLGEVERRASPATLEGAVSSTDADGKSVTVSYSGELVLETKVPFGLVVRPWDYMERGVPDFPSVGDTDELRRRIEGVQLAVFLAVDRPSGSWATARPAWQWLADPLSQGRAMGWADTRSSPGFMPYELTSKDCDEVASWTQRVDARWTPPVDIAVRRTLSAAHARSDAADRLVDAVIAWENLFGTSEGEPRLRISAAMAWLLEPSEDARRSRQDQIKRLYDDRSKIVHGARFDEQVIGERANDALSLARQSLQVLFRDRPDLLELADGAARSVRLILGG